MEKGDWCFLEDKRENMIEEGDGYWRRKEMGWMERVELVEESDREKVFGAVI